MQLHPMTLDENGESGRFKWVLRLPRGLVRYWHRKTSDFPFTAWIAPRLKTIALTFALLIPIGTTHALRVEKPE
jgi:hypothetical protein